MGLKKCINREREKNREGREKTERVCLFVFYTMPATNNRERERQRETNKDKKKHYYLSFFQYQVNQVIINILIKHTQSDEGVLPLERRNFSEEAHVQKHGQREKIKDSDGRCICDAEDTAI